MKGTALIGLGLALVGAVACMEPSYLKCGDQLCPSTTVCVGDDRCVTTDQITACDGLGDGSACELSGVGGRCEDGACTTSGCGDGVVDVDEVCDDGNVASGDGCRADCGKIEVCGDSLVDQGEACDDGNTSSADGCDDCRSTAWVITPLISGGVQAGDVGLSDPTDVVVDGNGNIYVADQGGRRVRRVDATGVVTVVAGSGLIGDSGDGGLATDAKFRFIDGIAVDGLGNLFIADGAAHRVRRVDASTGIITTVVGTGVSGLSGDGGLATAAQLAQPGGIVLDGLGTLYIADSANARVRRVDINGVITTFAGSTFGYSGDNGPATAAQLNIPLDVELHGADLYIADQRHRIRRVDGTGTITTVAGSSTSCGDTGDGGQATAAMLCAPSGVTVDAAGRIYINDTNNGRIRRIGTDGVITTVAGTTVGFSGDGGPAVDAQLSITKRTAFAANGDLVIADTWNNRIRRVSATTGVITTIAGNGLDGYVGDGGFATSARLAFTQDLAIDPTGHVVIVDTGTYMIRRVDSEGLIKRVAGIGSPGTTGNGGPAMDAQLASPHGMTYDALGNMYIADTNGSRVRRVDALTGIITAIAGTGQSAYGGDGGDALSAQLRNPTDVAVDAVGNVYIADQYNHRIRRVTPGGMISTFAGNGTRGSAGDGGQAALAELGLPTGLVFAPDGTLYVSVEGRVRRILTTGVIETVAGGGTSSADNIAATSARLVDPRGMTFSATGELYIADAGDDRIRRVDATGTITTIAGGGVPTGGFGHGGPATSAVLLAPTSVAIAADGTVYISEEIGAVVRVDADGVLRPVAGTGQPEGMGPLAQARLADPRAFVIAPAFTLVAGGSSGTVQAIRTAASSVGVVAGRYRQPEPTANLSIYRNTTFGSVFGVAFDVTAGQIYLAETSANRIHVVTITDPADASTWTIAPLANTAGTAGFLDGAAGGALFRNPMGLLLDGRKLYVADSGNHAIRVIDLDTSMVATVAGRAQTRGFGGDGGPASLALLHEPRAITKCGNDLFVADTANHRVRRIVSGTISTVVGVGVAASYGTGQPATVFPVHAPHGVACDVEGNLFVTSTNAIRLLPSRDGVVDGTGPVLTIYGAPTSTGFPESVTRCLTGVAIVDATRIQAVDACTGIQVELRRTIL